MGYVGSFGCLMWRTIVTISVAMPPMSMTRPMHPAPSAPKPNATSFCSSSGDTATVCAGGNLPLTTTV